MIRTFTVASVSLAVAVTLGACGGGGTATEDGSAAVDAAADQTEVIAEDAAAGAEAAADAVTDAGAEVVDEASDATAAVADAAGDGWTTLQGDWASSAGIVKDRWADLTEEEILGTDGDREQLVVLVQDRYGIERDQAEAEVDEWAGTL